VPTAALYVGTLHQPVSVIGVKTPIVHAATIVPDLQFHCKPLLPPIKKALSAMRPKRFEQVRNLLPQFYGSTITAAEEQCFLANSGCRIASWWRN